GPSNRIAHQPRLVGKKCDQENGLGQREAKITAQCPDVAPHRDPCTAWKNGAESWNQSGQHDRPKDKHSPDERNLERQRRSSQQRNDGRRSGQGPTQIVQHLPAADGWHSSSLLPPVGVWPTTEYPRQELPIPACPPVITQGGDVVAGGELLHNLDVG